MSKDRFANILATCCNYLINIHICQTQACRDLFSLFTAQFLDKMQSTQRLAEPIVIDAKGFVFSVVAEFCWKIAVCRVLRWVNQDTEAGCRWVILTCAGISELPEDNGPAQHFKICGCSTWQRRKCLPVYRHISPPLWVRQPRPYPVSGCSWAECASTRCLKYQ